MTAQLYAWGAMGMRPVDEQPGSPTRYVRDQDYERLLDRARAVVDAYQDRFESGTSTNRLFGPIDEHIIALRELVKP